MRDDLDTSVIETRERLLRFARRCGEGSLRLAMHAAVPQALRPDVVHLLRVNFVRGEADPGTSESDVLLAEFVEPLGADYFQMLPEARRQLLDNLYRVYASETPARSVRVGQFLLQYGEYRAEVAARDSLLAEYLELQRWVALGFADPDAAAAQFAGALLHAASGDRVACLQLGGLGPALRMPLARHPELLAYARGLDALERGDEETAEALLASLPERVAVGDVVLPPPAGIVARRRGGDGVAREEERRGSLATGEKPPGGEGAGAEPAAPDAGLWPIPLPSEPLIGRGELLQRVAARLLAGSRCIVLVGEPGVGKFAAARAVAALPEVRRAFTGGVFWWDRGEHALIEGSFPIRNGSRRLIVLDDVVGDAAIDTIRRFAGVSVLATGEHAIFTAAGSSDSAVEDAEQTLELTVVERLSPGLTARILQRNEQWAKKIQSSTRDFAMRSGNPLIAQLVGSDASSVPEQPPVDVEPAGFIQTSKSFLATLIDVRLSRCSLEARQLVRDWPSAHRFYSAAALAPEHQSSVQSLVDHGLLSRSGPMLELHPLIRERARHFLEPSPPHPRILVLAARSDLGFVQRLEPHWEFEKIEAFSQDFQAKDYDFGPYERVLVILGRRAQGTSIESVRWATRRCKPCVILAIEDLPPGVAFQHPTFFDWSDPKKLEAELPRLLALLAMPVEPEGPLLGIPPLPSGSVHDTEALASVRAHLLAAEDYRQVAVIGPKEVGKTLLALTLAHDCDVRRAYPGGVLLLPRDVAEWQARDRAGRLPERSLGLLDDPRSAEAVDAALARLGPGCALLVTTRKAGWVARVRAHVNVDAIPRSERRAPELYTPSALLNVRAEPSVTSEIVARVEPGTRLESQRLTGAFVRVRAVDRELEGWVHRRFLRRLDTPDAVKSRPLVSLRAPRVYISYSRDSDEHRKAVETFAHSLREIGIEAHLDHFYTLGHYDLRTPEDWDDWQREQIEVADFVLLVCTESYRDKVRSKPWTGSAKDVKWMGRRVVEGGTPLDRFIPVGFGPFAQLGAFIPDLFAAEPYCDIGADAGLRSLWGRLQPRQRDLVIAVFEPEDAGWFRDFRVALAPVEASVRLAEMSLLPTRDERQTQLETMLRVAGVLLIFVTPTLHRLDLSLESIRRHLDEASRDGLRVFWIPIAPSPDALSVLQQYPAAGDPQHPLARLAPADREAAWTDVVERLLDLLGMPGAEPLRSESSPP